MLIADSGYQDRARWRKAIENTRALTQQELASQKRQVKETQESEGGKFNPTNILDQMGRPMSSHELIRRLQKISSNLIFQKNNLGNFAVLTPRVERQPDGGEKTILSYTGVWFEDAIMPEYSVLSPTYDTAWDSEKRDIVQTLKTVKPTMGWRNVLGKLLLSGLVSPLKVRELFATEANKRASYAHMEKESGSLKKQGPILAP